MGSLFKKPEKKATCGECLKSLQLIVDGEATQEQEVYLMSHLDECLLCYNYYEMEKSVKKLLRNKIEKKACPESIIESIREKLRKPM
jgi:anti-sigma factor (TIGR02949 family)